MSAIIIDGKKIAENLRIKIAEKVSQLKTHGITPGLAVVLVGEDPASSVYVRNKHKATLEAGMNSFEQRLPENTSETDLLSIIEKLNNDSAVHGILVQLPLPKHIDSKKILEAISPEKDVDGFHCVNVGKLGQGDISGSIPCTPKGCMILLKTILPDLSGLHAVVIGRSNIVGKPMAQLLLAADCTVTIVHSKTKNLPDFIRSADIVIAAIGKPEWVQSSWLKNGATIIDVGINRLEDGRLVGDVDYKNALANAHAITPVPGGVGPMTIACLLDNTVKAAATKNSINLHE
jgi:methylenetetrahydrofolate dehydrogenase (NADP+)/methenyltetrahydrofolate cyclohydrolase